MLGRSLLVLLLTIAAVQIAAAVEPLDTQALAARLDKVLNDHPTAKRTTVTLKVAVSPSPTV